MVQYGKVVEMSAKGKALSGVSVTVLSAHDSYPTSSDAFGVFKLSFSEHQTGDVVYGLRAKKYGYEVVNLHVTRDGWTLTDRDTLRIVMAPSTAIYEARMRYYDLLETAFVARYDTTMRLLDAQLADKMITMPEYQYWKLEAGNELQRAYQNLETMVDVLVHSEEAYSGEPSEVVAALLNREESVLQAYTNFTSDYPMVDVGEMEAKAGLDSLPVADSLYQTVLVLQTYANLFESDFATNGSKYAKACAYLGVIYKEQGWDEASKKYLTRALRMYEMLNTLECLEVQDKINRIKELLEKP